MEAADDEANKQASSIMPITELQGPELLQRLKDEASALLEIDVGSLDAKAPLHELGFDSMMLTQFKGACTNTLGVDIDDAYLFDEECTLEKVQEYIEAKQKGIDLVAAAAQTSNDPQNHQAQIQKKKYKKPAQKCGFCGC